MARKPSALLGARIAGKRLAQAASAPAADGRMPLMEHLRELRNRVVKIVLAVLLGAGVSWAFFDRIWAFLQRPYCQAVGYCRVNTLGHSLFYTGVTDAFYLHIKVSAIAGAIITSPIWLYQLWAFIAPGMYRKEKRWTYVFLGTSIPLFGLGCFFAFLAMSRGLNFFLSLSGGLTAQFTADSYLSYWVAMIVGFGLCFEVPLFLVMLNVVRVITHERFRKMRRIVIFLIFVFAGIASPSPDPLTMLMLGGIVVVLVEVAEVLMYLNDKRYARNHPDLYAGLADDELAPIDDPEPVAAPEHVDQ
jgi:sec-independent protein translocase protein TatC